MTMLSELFSAVNCMLFTLDTFSEPVYTRDGRLVIDLPALVKLREWRDAIHEREMLICGSGRKVADYSVEVYDDLTSPELAVFLAMPAVKHIKMLLKAAEALPGGNQSEYLGTDGQIEGADLSPSSDPSGGAGLTGGGDELPDAGEMGVGSEHGAGGES